MILLFIKKSLKIFKFLKTLTIRVSIRYQFYQKQSGQEDIQSVMKPSLV